MVSSPDTTFAPLRDISKAKGAYNTDTCSEPPFWFDLPIYLCKRFECRFSAPRSHGNRVSSTAMASAVVCLGAARGGTDLGGAENSARRARWLRPKALPPRAPRRRSCIGVLLKSTWEWSAMVSSGHHIRSVGGDKQVKSAYCTGTYGRNSLSAQRPTYSPGPPPRLRACSTLHWGGPNGDALFSRRPA